ncbi:MAG: glycosyltransferase [Leptolyngbyaceae cyanobacterium bins.302]|nr:glycosyltransferase [Leptolyngbyaceae cyanobacterium bins.302]
MQTSTVYQSLARVDRRSDLEKWRKRNYYYYRDIESYYRFLVQPNAQVLEAGSGLGNLLSEVRPRYGLGIDLNTVAVDNAREKFPHLNFRVENVENFSAKTDFDYRGTANPANCFDYIILANTVSYIENIQKAFKNLRAVSQPSTRVILTFHNPAWEAILKLATITGQRMPLPPLNWLSAADITNLLELTDFEVVSHSKRFLFPRRVPGLAWFFNRVLAPLPLINRLCLTEYLVARPKPIQSERQLPVHLQKTCSVIVPARNEAGNIESCITRLPRMGAHTEVIFIEGHSSDNTWEEIQRVQAKYRDQWDIKICQQQGKGKGDAVRQGFEMATGDVLMILDSDLTVKPEDLPDFFEAVASGQCEMANGCRLIYPVSAKAMPLINRMANRFFAWLLSYLLNIKIKDSLCGTKVISRENYLKIAENRSYFGEFDPFGDFDLLFGAAKLSLKIKDIPVRYVPRVYGSSNIQHFKEGLVLLKMCLYAAKKVKFI